MVVCFPMNLQSPRMPWLPALGPIEMAIVGHVLLRSVMNSFMHGRNEAPQMSPRLRLKNGIFELWKGNCRALLFFMIDMSGRPGAAQLE